MFVFQDVFHLLQLHVIKGIWAHSIYYKQPVQGFNFAIQISVTDLWRFIFARDLLLYLTYVSNVTDVFASFNIRE